MQKLVTVLIAAAFIFTCFVSGGCSRDICCRSIEESVPTIYVEGSGRITAEPDEAIVRFGVASEEKTLKKAYGENTNSMNDIIKVVKGMGIDRKDMKTSSYSVTPVYPQDEKGRRLPGKPVSFWVNQQLTVKIRDLSVTGEVIDRTIENGANVFNGIQFSLSNIEMLERDAKAEAVKDAEQKAALIAKTLGVRIGRVLKVKEFSSRPYPTRNMAAFETMSLKAVPGIEAGSMEVTATCEIVYEIIQ